MTRPGRRYRRAAGRVLAVVVTVALVTGCAGSGRERGDGPARRTLTVLAAASLTDVFTELAGRYEADHPGVRVELVLGSSSALAAQLLAGAPGDVVATASPETMDRVRRAGLAGAPSSFASNRLRIVVPAANPGRVTTPADLARPGVTVALCQPEVPCGAAAALLLRRAGLRVRPVTLENDVRAVLTKVVLGEVDAGVVYRTDVRAGGDAVRGIPVPAAADVVTRYPISVLTDAAEPGLAEEFVALVRSPAGRGVLTSAGFGPP
jgi:molybdate transport system substrate-binding protein